MDGTFEACGLFGSAQTTDHGDLGLDVGAATLRIGLVNNMPKGAYLAAERQFGALMAAAARGRRVQLERFYLPGCEPAPDAGQPAATQRSTREVAAAGLDALIVTGAEPNAADLGEEAFWPDLMRLVDWAERTLTPTLWSCLAAHAAVLHLDGVPRRRLDRKCSGLFDIAVVDPGDDLPAADPLGPPWRMPHSRTNAVDEAELARRGYCILTRAHAAGVDAFTREATPAFLFCQGHPEYDADTLGQEFRRDVLRYLRGAQADLPILPQGYYDAPTAARLSELLDEAARRRSVEVMRRWPSGARLAHPEPVWRDLAIRLCRRWLTGAL